MSSAAAWHRALWVCAIVLAGAAPASTQTVVEFDHGALARQVLKHHIRPLYASFADKADRFRLAVDSGCQRRDASDEGTIKMAFRELVLAWSRTEHLRFGPITDKNRFERIMYWPDRQRIGERQVAQILAKRDPKALDPAELGQFSVTSQGLTALEIVLYGPSGKNLLSDTPEAEFACGYARSIAGNVATLAEDIAAEWAGGGHFATLWLTPGDANPLYRQAREVTIDVLKAYRNGINYARETKLLTSIGMKRASPGGPFAPKSQPPLDLSGHSLPSVIANIEGVLDLYQRGGFADRLQASDPQTAAFIKGKLETAIAMLAALEPAGRAAFNDPANIRQISVALAELSVVQLEGAGDLATLVGMGGMVLGFSDSDGD
ncbi:MAG: imelysin family protein [Hyphomicrobium sp.]|jgi:hypothetical protein